MKDSINVYLKVNKEDLYTLCPFFESFEGMAAIRIPKPAAGPHAILKLMVSPDFSADYDRLLASLGKKVWFERVVGEN
jgi:hypothetical protein